MPIRCGRTRAPWYVELARMGKQVHLLSGDRPQIVRHIARRLGIAAVRRRAPLPHDKLDYVQRLQRDGAIVAMVGDGVNDAAGLAAAQVSIAMGGGADIACSNSDVILLSGRLDALLTAVRAAHRHCASSARTWRGRSSTIWWRYRWLRAVT